MLHTYSLNLALVSFLVENFWMQSLVVLTLILLFYLIYLRKVRTGKREIENLENTINNHTVKLEKQQVEIDAQRTSLEESIDQLKRAEDIIDYQKEQLKDNNTELENVVAQRTSDLKLVVDQLVATNDELDKFVYRSAHDLRGPVSRLMGICNLVKADKSFMEDPLFIENLDATAYQMDTLIKRLIALNTIKNKGLEKEIIDIKQIVDRVVQSMITEEDDFKVNIDVESFAYESDPILIEILIKNVLSNSIRYIDISKEEHIINIKVKLEPSKNDFEIVIEDNGMGFNDLVKDSLFEMFYKGVNHSQGFGLGLYEVNNIVKRLGGQVCLTCEGDTTTFKTMLPLKMTEGYESIIKKLF